MLNKDKLIKIGAGVLTAAMLLGGCSSIDPKDTLVTIEAGDDTISLGYGNFLARYTQATYDQYYRSYFGDSYWNSDIMGDGSTMIESTKSDLLETMEKQYLCKLHAEEYGVELSDEQKAAIDEAAAAFMKDNSEELIEEMGATEDYVKDMLTYQTYEKLVSDAVKEQAEIEITDDEVNQSTISYVFFDITATTDESGNEVEKTEEEIAVAKTNAEAVAASDDLDAAAESFSQTVQTASFTSAADDETAAEDAALDVSIITAAKALSEGEISDVIEVEDSGYYVIRMDSTFDETATNEKRATLDTEKRDEAYDDLLEEWKAKIGWVVDKKAWKKVKFDTLFEVVTETEGTESTEGSEGTESTEDTEASEGSEDTESTDTESTEGSEDTQSTESTENSQSSEGTE